MDGSLHIVFLEYKSTRLMLTILKNERIFDLRLKASARFGIDPKSFILKAQGIDLSSEESQFFSDYFRKKAIVTICVEDRPKQITNDKSHTGFSLKKYLLNLSVLNPQSSDLESSSTYEASINGGLLKLNQRKLKLNFKNKLTSKISFKKKQSDEIKEMESNQKHLRLLKFQTSQLRSKFTKIDASSNRLPIVAGLSIGFKTMNQENLNIKRCNTESLKEKEISVNKFNYENFTSERLENELTLPAINQSTISLLQPATERLNPIVSLKRRETRFVETSSDKSTMPTPQSKKLRVDIAETSDPTQFINMDRKFRVSPLKAQTSNSSQGINY